VAENLSAARHGVLPPWLVGEGAGALRLERCD
jgi:hypothetical protein